MKEIAKFIASHPPFDALDAEKLNKVVRSIQIEYFTADVDVLIQGGAPARFLYLVRKGSVDLIFNENEQIRVIETLHEGDAFGHPSLIRNKPPLVTVRTRTDVLVYLVPVDVFLQTYDAEPNFARFFSKDALSRLNLALEIRQSERMPEAFRGALNKLTLRPPISISGTATIQQAAAMMRQNGIGSLLVRDETSPKWGILTDRDLRNRVLAEGRDGNTLVREVATSNAISLPSNVQIFEGLMLMMEQKIHHLLVSDPAEPERIIGVCTHTDFLRSQIRSPLFLPRQLERAQSLEDYRRYVNGVQEVVLSMSASGAKVSDIGRMVAIANDALTQQLLLNAETTLGAPPCPYAWLVCGSEGRFEQTLKTDQDNALVFASDAPADAQEYFLKLATHVVEQIVACGFPRCPGNIMATNNTWRQPLDVWQSYFQHWIETPDEESLYQSAIFFDYRKVYGSLDVEKSLRPIIHRAIDNRIFLGRLARAALRQPAPFGFFNRLILEHRDGRRDVLDIKYRGVAMIVDLARLFALQAGVSATNTIERLRLSADKSSLDVDTAEELASAFEVLNDIRLRHQAEQVQQGVPPDNLIRMERYRTRDRATIKDALRVVERAQQSVAFEFQTERLA
jgi:CBS domain-containing protein